MNSHEQKHAVVTCYDPRLNPFVERYKQELANQGHEVLSPLRPVGGVHAMTRSACRHFFYDQLDGLVLVGKATHIHIFPHTNCQYGWLKVREKVGDTPEQDLAFQIDILRKSCAGAEKHLKQHFPDRSIRIIGGIVLTQEGRVIDLDVAEELVPKHHQGKPSHDGAAALLT